MMLIPVSTEQTISVQETLRVGASCSESRAQDCAGDRQMAEAISVHSSATGESGVTGHNQSQDP